MRHWLLSKIAQLTPNWHWIKLAQLLTALSGMLNADQVEVVENMIQRYNLIMIELEGEGSTVLTDLELLSSKLNTLEATLFATP